MYKKLILILSLIVFAPQIIFASEIDPAVTAAEIVSQMTIGWNLGNTLDAHNSRFPGRRDDMGNLSTVETRWLEGSISSRTTESLIQAVIDSGFNTIRIPVTWHKAITDAPTANEPGFESGKFEIDERWMAHVQSIVDMAYNRGMFVILNTHHDEVIIRLGSVTNNQNDENYATALEQALVDRENGRKAMVALWTQIAEHFKDYDERLIFESLNEPRHRANDENGNWNGAWDWWGTNFARESVNILNQEFVNVVRKTGGNNRYRLLMMPTYGAQTDHNPWGQLQAFRLPTDTIAENGISKFILSVHVYSPHDWAHDGRGENPGINAIQADLSRIADRAAQLNIPVILGEWGTVSESFGERKGHSVVERTIHAYDYVRIATSMENRSFQPAIMRTVVWDDYGNFRIINRQNRPHVNEDAAAIINAMRAGRGDLESLRSLLRLRISYAETLMQSTEIAVNAHDVSMGSRWVTQQVMNTFITAVNAAKRIVE